MNKREREEKERTSGCGGVGGGAHSRGDRQKCRLTSQQTERERANNGRGTYRNEEVSDIAVFLKRGDPENTWISNAS